MEKEGEDEFTKTHTKDDEVVEARDRHGACFMMARLGTLLEKSIKVETIV